MKLYRKLFALVLVFAMTLSVPTNKSQVEAANNNMPLITGSFIQGWLCRDWTQDRWNKEFAAMKELGMESLIIQSSYDWATTATSSSAYGQDWTQYTTTSRYSLYPTTIPELAGAYNSADQLERALIAAKANNMSIYIGLISDDRWWRFGWGIPTSATYGVDLTTDSYFAKWCEYNGELSAQMIEEIWNRYGDNYGEQISGWYYHNEIWNFDAGCAGTDSGVYAKILGNSFNYYLDAINENCPKKPLMVSPYFNRTLSTAVQYSDFWKAIFKNANFRAGDIFAPQDCIGEHADKIDTLEAWIGGLADAAATETGLRFWVNNETFTSSYTSASVERVISQIEETTKYAQTHILFSWNHYYNPVYNSSYQSYHDALAAYIEEEKAKREEANANKIQGGIELNGFQISANKEGFRTIYSVENSIDGKDVVECGLVYALTDQVTAEEIYVGNNNENVASFAGTSEGQCPGRFTESETATSYAMTMLFAEKTPIEFETGFSVRAYAKLSDGSYVYSDISNYTIYAVADVLYQNGLMSSKTGHEYIYKNILSKVNMNYVMKEYDWIGTIVGGEE